MMKQCDAVTIEPHVLDLIANRIEELEAENDRLKDASALPAGTAQQPKMAWRSAKQPDVICL